MAEEEEERYRKNQVLVTLDKAYKTSVKKVEELMERHMDVSIIKYFLVCMHLFMQVLSVSLDV